MNLHLDFKNVLHFQWGVFVFQLQSFFTDRLDPSAALQAAELMKQVISEVLTAAVLTTADSSSPPRSLSYTYTSCQTFQHYNIGIHQVVLMYVFFSS